MRGLTFLEHGDKVVKVAVHGHLTAAAGNDFRVKIWNHQTLAFSFFHDARVSGLAFTPGGTLISVSEDGTVRKTTVRESVVLEQYGSRSPLTAITLSQAKDAFYFSNQSGRLFKRGYFSIIHRDLGVISFAVAGDRVVVVSRKPPRSTPCLVCLTHDLKAVSGFPFIPVSMECRLFSLGGDLFAIAEPPSFGTLGSTLVLDKYGNIAGSLSPWDDVVDVAASPHQPTFIAASASGQIARYSRCNTGDGAMLESFSNFAAFCKTPFLQKKMPDKGAEFDGFCSIAIWNDLTVTNFGRYVALWSGQGEEGVEPSLRFEARH